MAESKTEIQIRTKAFLRKSNVLKSGRRDESSMVVVADMLKVGDPGLKETLAMNKKYWYI